MATPLVRSDGTNVRIFAYDGLGSVRQLTDGTGTVQLAQTFDPYGNGYAKSRSATTTTQIPTMTPTSTTAPPQSTPTPSTTNLISAIFGHNDWKPVCGYGMDCGKYDAGACKYNGNSGITGHCGIDAQLTNPPNSPANLYAPVPGAIDWSVKEPDPNLGQWTITMTTNNLVAGQSHQIQIVHANPSVVVSATGADFPLSMPSVLGQIVDFGLDSNVDMPNTIHVTVINITDPSHKYYENPMDFQVPCQPGFPC